MEESKAHRSCRSEIAAAAGLYLVHSSLRNNACRRFCSPRPPPCPTHPGRLSFSLEYRFRTSSPPGSTFHDTRALSRFSTFSLPGSKAHEVGARHQSCSPQTSSLCAYSQLKCAGGEGALWC